MVPRELLQEAVVISGGVLDFKDSSQILTAHIRPVVLGVSHTRRGDVRRDL
jgi:hypothetical protein